MVLPVTMVLVRETFDELQLSQIKLIQCKEDCEHEMETGDGKLIYISLRFRVL
jgi:hypothetical protein